MKKYSILIQKLYFKNIFNNFSLKIPSQNFAIVGANGSGKSTLVKIMCGILQPDAGKVVFTTPKLSVGYCSQQNIWPSNVSVRSIVNFFAHIHKFTTQQINSHSLFKSLGINLFFSKKSSLLSGGQSRRLAIFLSLFYNPNIVFLDEPFNDVDTKHSLMKTIKKYCEQHHIQIILISHSIFEITYLTSVGIFLKHKNTKTGVSNINNLKKMMLANFIN